MGDGRGGLVGRGGDRRRDRAAADQRPAHRDRGQRARARHTLTEGEERFVALGWRHGLNGPDHCANAKQRLQTTFHYWRDWLAGGRFPDHRWRQHLQRSALTLKGLTYAPTGSTVAAATTSLPETPGGERNWDYRYCWMRDATFTLWGLHALGLDWEADDFMQFVADLERDGDGALQIMYGLGGERDLHEQVLVPPQRLRGRDAGPDRQRRLSASARTTCTAPCSTRSTCTPSAGGHIPQRLWPVLQDQVRCALDVWRKPDQGIWEARGEPKHYVSSKLMCWVAAGSGRAAGRARGRGELAAEWRAVAEEIREDILSHGVSERGVFRQHYETDALDASTLLIPLVRFLPPDDERVRATVLAIASELQENGFVLRYRVAGDRRRPERRGGHVPDLLVLAGVGAVGDRRDRAGGASCASGCSRTRRRSGCTPRSSRPAPGGTWATTRRRSPTWR